MLTLLSTIICAIAAFLIWRLTSRLLLHPLAHYPGPKLAALSNLPYVKWTLSGRLHQRLLELHDEYGEVVRIRPNALTYRPPEAWKDIYGHPKPGHLPFSKDPEFYGTPPQGKAHLVNADEADHSRQKKLLSSAFSDRAMRQQEPIIMSYIDLFISRLHGLANDEAQVKLEEWLNFLTFDIVGDLAFGAPFGCLEDSEYHPWVATIFQSIKTGAFLRALSVYPRLAAFVRSSLPKRVTQKRDAHYQMSKERVTRRLESEVDRPDFISHIQKRTDERGMRQSEVELNAAIIIQAGSETTATVLAAAIYYLAKHPGCWEKATHEVRSTYKADHDISLSTTQQLPYISSVIEETLRMFPPLPGVLPRQVPKGGAVINGNFVQEGVSVSVPHYATFRGTLNFTKPDSFVPERWLKEGREGAFASDRRDALQPFSFGTRACIGRSLAYAEMSTVLAKLLWHFDITLQPESDDWDKVKSYIVWEKIPLKGKLSKVPR